MKLILLRGDTCHVTRPIVFLTRVSLNAGRLVSKSTSHFVGSPPFLLKNIPGMVFSA